jgi:prophage regulatory protein
MTETTDRLMRDAEVKAKTTLSRAQRWRLEQKGKFPKRVELSGRTVAWRESEINEWIASRPRAHYLPRGAVLGPAPSDDTEKPKAAPRPIAKPRRGRPRKRLASANPAILNISA